MNAHGITPWKNMYNIYSTQTNTVGSQLSELQLSKHLDNLTMTILFCCCVCFNRVIMITH